MQTMEQRVISIFLRHPDEIIKHDLQPADFETPHNGHVFSIMRKIALEGGKVDPFIISDQIDRKGVLADLVDLQTKFPAAVENISNYVSKIKSAAKRKKLKAKLQAAIDLITDDSDPDSVAGELVAKLSGLAKQNTTKVFDGRSMMRSTIDHLERMFDLKSEGKLAGVPSGIKKLDTFLGGFHPSDLVIVGARPAMGKTALGLTCAVNAAQQGFKVGFVSTEMSVEQVGMRVASLISGISSAKMRDYSFDDTDFPRMTAATAKIADLPLRVYDEPSCTVSDIAIQARAWKMTAGLDILIVDYLTRLRPETHNENRTLAVGDIATGLKTLARNLNIPVVILAQLSREVTKRRDSIPQMADLRDSGVIEQEADQILLLYRATVYDKNAPEDGANIIIEKNRHGEIATLNLQFHKETMRWDDPSVSNY